MISLPDVLAAFPGSRVVPRLRPYQAAAVDAVKARFASGVKRTLVVMPTGAGKSVFASAIINESERRCLFIVHRQELVEQMRQHLERLGITASIIRAGDTRYDPSARVQIAMQQTILRRKLDWEPGLVFVDEAHLSAADGWRKVLDRWPDALVIGLTATPCRKDGRPLGDYFQAIDVGATYSELIALNGGHPDQGVVEPLVYSAEVEPDLSCVRRQSGDYAEGELGAVMSQPKIVGSVVDEYLRHGQGQSGLVFAVTVLHSELLCEAFKAKGIAAEHVDGTTTEQVRRATWARFATGETRIVCNVGIATTGFDEPRAKYLGLARPTQSLVLYMQMAGRVLRPWNGVRPILCDHGGNVDRHGYPTEDRAWSLTTAPVRIPEKNPYKMCKACFAFVRAFPCEHCGWTPPAVKVPPPKADETVALEHRMRGGEAEKKRFFERAVEKARLHGWKSGAPGAQYKEKYGAWPPWDWTKRAREYIEADLEWSAARAENEARKAAREASEGEGAAGEVDGGGVSDAGFLGHGG